MDPVSETDDDYFDIIIVGGGMVGASLGCALIGSGLKVAVVETIAFGSDEQPSFDQRTIALTYGSARIFDGLGVWEPMHSQGATPINRIQISDQGHFGSTVLDRSDANVAALGYVVPARVLGDALLKRIQQAENIAFLCPAKCEQVDVGSQKGEVRISAGGKARKLSAKLLVLADGGRSQASQQLGLVSRATPYPQQALVTTVVTGQDHSYTAYERFTSSGPLALLPSTGKSYAVVWTLYPEQASTHLNMDDQAFLSALQTSFGDRAGAFLKLGRRHLYPLSRSTLVHTPATRLAIIGNAAHTLHPVAGQGFNLGLRDVAALAQKLVDAQTNGIDIGGPTILRSYEKLRLMDVKAVSNFTHGLISIFTNEFGPLVTARNLGLAGINIFPGVKRRLLRFSMGLNAPATRLGMGRPLT